MGTSAPALALCLALLLAPHTHGEGLASPRRVRFAAETTWHVLRWEPGHGHPRDVCYDVEYKVYGTKIPWTAIPECTKSSRQSCDLTFYTLDPDRRYYARVRAVSGNHTSSWQRTNAFSPQDASLRLSGQSLSVRGNTIHVQLQLLFQTGKVTVRYEDIHEDVRQYRVYTRRTQDNKTFEVVETRTEFTLSNLLWGTEYCLSVEPSVTNRHLRTTRTDEQCVTTSQRDRIVELLPSILSPCFIVLLGILGALLVHTYIKKPMRTPSVLKSFMKQSSLWVEHEPSSSGSLDTDPIQQLFLCQKEPQLDRSTSTAQVPLEQGWRLPVRPEDRLCPLGPVGSRDNSGSSTDSGICLHIPSSSPGLSCSARPEPRGYRRQLPTGDDSGVGLESPCPGPTCSSSSGNSSQGEPELCPATGQEAVEFRGYLQQCRGTVEPGQDPAKGMPLSGCEGPGQGTDLVLDVECSELAVSKGYLKQSSPEHPRGNAQDLAPWGAPSLDFSSQVGPLAPTLLSWGAPSAPLVSKACPELLKAPFDLSIFNTDILGMLPLTSSLSTDWLTLPVNPLSLLSGDSKDSRL
ncbi:interleukin-10 receptor subunit alpha isoform X2 [Chiroxiphia lanceolata]|uniref:interleukin-10 receptor subunit alpha isoform X2 n=1 Tax=Chiroxiphia lanceolata TaxID=296741 RepID=UPI0013CEC288|nr:interleukin-10 receptor subunit alpha isoform X2 [Chiroxiphia lanceolata]